MTWAKGVFVTPDQGQFANSLGQMMVLVIFLQSAIVTFLAGPIVASITGLFAGISVDGEKQSAILGGIGAFGGFYIMVITAVIVMSLAIDGGSSSGSGSGFDIGRALGPIAKAGIPTGIVGALTGYVGGSFIDLDVHVSSKQASASVSSDD